MKKHYQFAPNKQNDIEKQVEKILNNNYPGKFKYLGDSDFKIGECTPDFVDMADKKIVEVLGCYWHSCRVCNMGNKRDQDKDAQDTAIHLAIYGMNGYKTLAIWEHELKSEASVLKRIDAFMKK